MTLYDDLGVPKDASPDEIKRAYRRKAKQNHPDRKGGSTDAMSTINRAYMTLSDPEKRERYDRMGDDGSHGVKPTIEQRAHQALMQGFAQLMERASDDMDWFKLLRDGISQQKAKVKQNKQMAERDIRRTEKARKRIRGGTLFDGLLDQRLLSARNAIAGFEEELLVIAESEKMLRGYEMEIEEPVKRTPSFDPSSVFMRYGINP
jgi:curved DNA-binding protein CbpA